MGLDNIPKPYPCKVRGYAVLTKDGKIDCEKTDCPFKKLPHVIGILGTYCWLRGKVYENIVHRATDGKYSLYEELGLRDLRNILKAVKKYKPEDKIEAELKEGLVKYLETLLSEVKGCRGFKLVPWW